MDDVYKFLLSTGMATEKVTELYQRFGVETKNLSLLLNITGFSVKSIASNYTNLTESINTATTAQQRLAEAMAGQGGAIPEDLSSEIAKRIMLVGAGVYTAGEVQHYYDKLREGLPWMEFPDLVGLPAIAGFAEGGIVKSPQLAMVGEKGAEAIIPLNKMGQSVTVYVAGSVRSDRDLVQIIREELNRIQRSVYSTNIS
jgi:hypothetical protein